MMYQEIRPQIKPGDVIVFSGVDWFSRMIQLVTRSKYSHVGIVIDADFGEGLGERHLLAESTTSGLDMRLNKIVKGVQFSWLSRRVKMATEVGEKMYLLPLKEHLTSDEIMKLKSYLDGCHTKSYDLLQAIGASIDVLDDYGVFNNDVDINSFFCSELVVAAFQHIGLLDESINCSEQLPKDVVNLDCFESLISLN